MGWHPNPWKHFGPDGVEGAEARCAEANRDLLGFLRQETRPRPGSVACLGHQEKRAWSVESLAFPSPAPCGHPVNHTVYLRVYRPRRLSAGARSVLLFHHPIYQERWLPWEWFLAGLLRRVPVAMMAAPFHFRRTPPGEYPGESVCNPNPWRLFEAIRQWCADQGAVLRVLPERSRLEPVAVIGFSLGAFQALLSGAAGLHELPVVSIASTNRYAWGVFHGSIGEGLRRGMEAVGIDEPRLWRMTESVQLERYAPRLRGRGVLYVAGDYDRVDPPPSLARLEAALAPSHTLHLRAGHATVLFYRRAITRAIWSFLAELGLGTF